MAERKIYYGMLDEDKTEFEKQDLTKKEAIVDSIKREEFDPVREFGGRVPIGLGIGEQITVNYAIRVCCRTSSKEDYYEIVYLEGALSESLEGLISDMGLEECVYLGPFGGRRIDKTKLVEKLKGRKVLAHFSGDELVGLSAPEE